MANWYVFTDKISGRAVSIGSDDTKDFSLVVPTCNITGPFASQAAAAATLPQPALDAKAALRSTLQAKSSATWTTADIADYLKALQ
jgi:hypothetical protein